MLRARLRHAEAGCARSAGQGGAALAARPRASPRSRDVRSASTSSCRLHERRIAPDARERRAATRCAAALLANGVIEDFRFELAEERSLRCAGGSSLSRARTTTTTRSTSSSTCSATDAVALWHKDRDLKRRRLRASCPGGFSYGDYLRCGAMARFSPVMETRGRVRARGRARARHLQRLPDPLRGRACCPGALDAQPRRCSFVCDAVHVRVENTETPFTHRCRPGEVLEHADQARRGLLRRRRGDARARSNARIADRVPLRRPRPGASTPEANPNGSLAQHRRHLQRSAATSSASCRTPSTPPSALVGGDDGLKLFHSVQRLGRHARRGRRVAAVAPAPG